MYVHIDTHIIVYSCIVYKIYPYTYSIGTITISAGRGGPPDTGPFIQIMEIDIDFVSVIDLNVSWFILFHIVCTLT